MERLIMKEARIKRLAQSVRNEREEDLSQLLLQKISDQLIGDVLKQMLTNVRVPSKGHEGNGSTNFLPCFNLGITYFDSLCGCIDDTTDEDGASTSTSTSSWAIYPCTWALSDVAVASDGSSTTYDIIERRRVAGWRQ